MEKKRINKDLIFLWPITINGEIMSLVGMDLKVVLRDPLRRDSELSFTTAGNKVRASFPSSLQRVCGAYHLTLWMNYGKDGQTAVDACNAVELVPTTCSEVDEHDGLDTEVIEVIEGNLETILRGENGATFTPHVDEAGNLSWTNDKDLENPETVNIKGQPGDDGKSVTHSWNGTELTLNSASGTTVTDLKGKKGDRGISGNLNYPRVRVNEKKHLIIYPNTESDKDRFKLNKGHLLIKL